MTDYSDYDQPRDDDTYFGIDEYPPYDSTQDTLAHIRIVQANLQVIANQLIKRMIVHDESKLKDPELSLFNKINQAKSTDSYNDKNDKIVRESLSEALEHHYSSNSHHPEHYGNGIDGMSLLDIIEMFCDWKAANIRHVNGSMPNSLKMNKDRFKMAPQLVNIFQATIDELEW